MALQGTDLAILSARMGVARLGASRLGFCPDDVEGAGTSEPGEYVWKEQKPPTTLWTLQSQNSVCGFRPVASFTDTPDPSVEDTETVTFTDTSTPTYVVTYWCWDFGDGSAYSYEQNPTHIYTDPGTYTVTLYISGTRGSASATGTHTVTAATFWANAHLYVAGNAPKDYLPGFVYDFTIQLWRRNDGYTGPIGSPPSAGPDYTLVSTDLAVNDGDLLFTGLTAGSYVLLATPTGIDPVVETEAYTECVEVIADSTDLGYLTFTLGGGP